MTATAESDLRDVPTTFLRGFLAEREGHGTDSNPFPKLTPESRQWSAGWLAAREHPYQEPSR